MPPVGSACDSVFLYSGHFYPGHFYATADGMTQPMMNRWFFSLLATIGAQREGSLARRAAFVGWMSAPVYLLFALWTAGGWLLARHDLLPQAHTLGYAALYGLALSALWLGMARYGLWLDHRRRPDQHYASLVLWSYAACSVVTCYFVGSLSIIAGLVMMGAPLIGMMLFPMRQILVVFGTALVALLSISIASALGYLPYAPVLNAGLVAERGPELYYAFSGILGSGLYVVYETIIMMALVSAWHYREAGVLALSQTDALTGVANRRHIIEELDTLLATQARNDDCIAVVMVDIDHFKQINDRHGHIAGDRALAAAADALRHCLRTSDRIGRYGGEEFLILLPGATREKAGEIAERCRLAVGAVNIDANGTRLTLTASLGVSSQPASSVRDADHIIHFADEAMYLAKQAGRNRIVVA